MLYFHEIGLIYFWTLYCGNVQTQAWKRGRNTQWTLCPQPGFTKCPLCNRESVSSAATLLFYWDRWKWTPNTIKCEYIPHLKMRKIWLLLLRWNMILTAKWLIYTISWITWQTESEFWNKNHTIISLIHNPQANLIRTSSKSSSLPGTLRLWGSFI